MRAASRLVSTLVKHQPGGDTSVDAAPRGVRHKGFNIVR